MRNNFLRVCLSVAFLLVFLLPNAQRGMDAAAYSARAECVLEVSSRRILHEKNAATPLPNASTTKVLTAILIIDDCDLTEEVTIPAQAAGTEGSSIYLKAGDVYTAEELLYGLMLRSGNDAAVALALHHSGSIEAFAQAMNEKAAMLGARDSLFVNPHGLPDKRHKTTACDLALIAAYAMQNETFRTIVSTKYYAARGWQNKNKMLFSYEGANGVKTGFTTDAGRCLVTSAERGDMSLVSVVLNAPEMYEHTAQLLNTAFGTYRMATLTDRAMLPDGVVAREAFRYPLRKGEEALVHTEVHLLDPLPQEQGAIAGFEEIFLENNLLFSQNLYIMEENRSTGRLLCESTNFWLSKASALAAPATGSSLRAE